MTQIHKKSEGQESTLGLHFFYKLGGIDNESLVESFTDKSAFVEGLYFEYQSSTVDLNQFGIAPHTHTDRCGSSMSHIDQSSHRALSLVKVR